MEAHLWSTREFLTIWIFWINHILDCTTNWLLDINPLSIQIITTNCPLLLQTAIQRSSLTMHHSQLLDAAISPKMRSRLSSWSILPIDMLLLVHRNLKNKYSPPLCFLLSSYSIFKKGRERQFIVYQTDVRSHLQVTFLA